MKDSDTYDQMVEKVYTQMRSKLPTHVFDESNPKFYEHLEIYVKAIYDPNFDPDELHKAIKRFKKKPKSASVAENLSHLQEVPLHLKRRILSSSDCVQRIIEEKKNKGITIDDQALAIAYSECGESRKASLEKRLQKLKLTILSARGFKPDLGEKPDENGNYWRSTDTGKRYPIKPGEDPKEKAQEVIDKIKENKSDKSQDDYMEHAGQKYKIVRFYDSEDFSIKIPDSIKELDYLARGLPTDENIESYEELKRYDVKYDGDTTSFYMDDYMDEPDAIFQAIIETQKKYNSDMWQQYKAYNDTLRKHYEKTRVAYRGTNLKELESILEMGLRPNVGGDFDVSDSVSHCTVSIRVATGFAESQRSGAGIVLKFRDGFEDGTPLQYLPLNNIDIDGNPDYVEVSDYGLAGYAYEHEVRFGYETGAVLDTVYIVHDPQYEEGTKSIIDEIRKMGWEGKIELAEI